MPLSSDELKQMIEGLPEEFTLEDLADVMRQWVVAEVAGRIAKDWFSMLPEGGVFKSKPAPVFMTNEYVVTREQAKRMAKYRLDKDLYLD